MSRILVKDGRVAVIPDEGRIATDTCPGCHCDDEPGACCIDGECSQKTRSECIALGGEFVGKGVDCEDVICPPDNPCTPFGCENRYRNNDDSIDPGPFVGPTFDGNGIARTRAFLLAEIALDYRDLNGSANNSYLKTLVESKTSDSFIEPCSAGEIIEREFFIKMQDTGQGPSDVVEVRSFFRIEGSSATGAAVTGVGITAVDVELGTRYFNTSTNQVIDSRTQTLRMFRIYRNGRGFSTADFLPPSTDGVQLSPIYTNIFGNQADFSATAFFTPILGADPRQVVGYVFEWQIDDVGTSGPTFESGFRHTGRVELRLLNLRRYDPECDEAAVGARILDPAVADRLAMQGRGGGCSGCGDGWVG